MPLEFVIAALCGVLFPPALISLLLIVCGLRDLWRAVVRIRAKRARCRLRA